jgi:hypothetical protein
MWDHNNEKGNVEMLHATSEYVRPHKEATCYISIIVLLRTGEAFAIRTGHSRNFCECFAPNVVRNQINGIWMHSFSQWLDRRQANFRI